MVMVFVRTLLNFIRDFEYNLIPRIIINLISVNWLDLI